ncbi:ATP F0F1 synthase synthase [Stutzerimonas kirkiae]|uniref:ATP F0F1 synthase synthase n=1 Tax=Stutzerimonas kirkiae TaxID=2211392 RepID=A0A4Q9QWI9_9GAMM|nr:ATP F0F1 synthase synthase [Stutzerimonas kirkiae]TBU88335.1 ATP F0F1 synthase synthase [Stutzerimonas kirkiae]TBU98424.1 ATP F0F1 synthase synthase [Stutzerimonas kirkiae]TBV16167.1 ATP F0F1 synthase synthase [Stutzerimonas kirkiae]
MDHVLARVKRLTKKPFFKLVSDHTLYENTNINLATCVPYSPDHNLDEDSWFKVEQFSQQPFCIDLLKSNFDSKDYDDLKKEQFANISYVFAVQGDNFYFQKITSSLFIRKKIIGFGEAAAIEESSNRLVINDQPDAIYFKHADTLVFRNLAAISGIFKGIDALYREATQQETEAFLKSAFIELKNNYDASKVSKPNRKRIALAMDSLTKMSAQDKMDILAYIGDYCDQKLKFDQTTKKFEISTDDELKLLLYGVEQRFYTTLFGQERRIANSVRPVG